MATQTGNPIRAAALAVTLIFPLHSQQIPAGLKIPADLIWEPDIEYTIAGGKGTRLAMDVVRPRASGKPLPAVVLIHGQ